MPSPKPSPKPSLKSSLGPLALLRRSLGYRRARSVSAVVALTVSAALATALLTLYSSLEAKLHREFRSFGANILVTAAPNQPLPPETLSLVRRAAGPDAVAAPSSFAVATTDRGTPAVVVGTDFAATRRLDSFWKVDLWPTGPDQALLGAKAANFIADEHLVKLLYAGKPATFQGVGRLHTGGDEESRIYVPLPAFTAWTGLQPTVIEVQVPGNSPHINTVLEDLRRNVPPGVTVQPVRQLVEAESRIVDRTRALMLGAVILIVATVGVSVLATLSASVLERRRDFALMKALGGSEAQLVGLFLLEVLSLALLGVVAGWIVGSGIAALISEVNFSTGTAPRLSVLPLVLLLNASIAACAALLPARVLRTLQPAALLKGE